MNDAEFAKLTTLKQREERYFRIRFPRHISSVKTDMQPEIMKEYIMKAIGCLNSQPVYVIASENGRPLIVYKDEFEVIGLAEPSQYSGI